MEEKHLKKLETYVKNEGRKMPVAYKHWYAISSEPRKPGLDRGLISLMHQTNRMFVKPFYKPISVYSVLMT
jgi:hypothetical protein